MGLDIYAGTLTRYYSHNWKTVVQQWSEENGYAFNRITPDGESADNEEELSPAEIQAAVGATDWKIGRIAQVVGYANEGHFYKLFQQKYHLSPGEYRRKCEKS